LRLLSKGGAPALDVYTDSAYVIAGAARDRTLVRRRVRCANGPLWDLFFSLYDELVALGTDVALHKVAAHGRGGDDQAPRLTAGNFVADALAVAAVDLPAISWAWAPTSCLDFSLCGMGGMVMGDPRRCIRDTYAEWARQRWLGKRSEGRVARVVAAGDAAVGSAALTSSARSLALSGSFDIMGAGVRLRTLAYRTPSRWYRGPSTPDREKLVLNAEGLWRRQGRYGPRPESMSPLHDVSGSRDRAGCGGSPRVLGG
jgi:hypothetical protein